MSDFDCLGRYFGTFLETAIGDTSVDNSTCTVFCRREAVGAVYQCLRFGRYGKTGNRGVAGDERIPGYRGAMAWNPAVSNGGPGSGSVSFYLNQTPSRPTGRLQAGCSTGSLGNRWVLSMPKSVQVLFSSAVVLRIPLLKLMSFVFL